MQYSLRQNEPVHSVHSLEQTIITIYHNAKQFLLDLSFLRRKLYVFFDFLTVSKFIIHCKTYKRVRNILQDPWIYTHCFSHMVQILTLRTLDPLLILNCFAAYRLGFKWYSQLFSCWLLEHLLAFSQNLSSSSWCTLSMRISFLFIAYRCHRGCLPRIGGRAQNQAQNILCKLLIFWPIV